MTARVMLQPHGDPYPIEGMVFLAQADTIDEMLQTLLFGMPAARFKLVRRVRIGTPIFLYDLHNMVFHGCFEAVSPGCLNLDPNAFGGSRNGGSRFPAQVQVVQSERYPPTHWWLFENVPGLFYAGTNKVDQLLNDEQVHCMREAFRKELRRITFKLGPPVPCKRLRPQAGPLLPPGTRPEAYQRPYGEPLDTYVYKQLSEDYYQSNGQRNGPEFLDPVDDGTFTTVILKNLPLGLDGDMLVDSLGRCGYFGRFDFVLIRASNPERVGHAIINFTSREAAEAIFPGIAEVLGYWPPWDLGRIQKPVSWAKAQGTAGLQRAFDFVIPVVEGDPSNFHIQDNTAFIFILPEDNRPGVFSVPVLSPVPTPHTAYSPYSPPQAPRAPHTPPSALVQDEDLDEGEIPPEATDATLPSVAPWDDSAAFQMPNGLQMRFPGGDGRRRSGDGKGEYSAELMRISHPDDHRRRRNEGGAERDRLRHEGNDYRHRDDAYEERGARDHATSNGHFGDYRSAKRSSQDIDGEGRSSREMDRHARRHEPDGHRSRSREPWHSEREAELRGSYRKKRERSRRREPSSPSRYERAMRERRPQSPARQRHSKGRPPAEIKPEPAEVPAAKELAAVPVSTASKQSAKAAPIVWKPQPPTGGPKLLSGSKKFAKTNSEPSEKPSKRPPQEPRQAAVAARKAIKLELEAQSLTAASLSAKGQADGIKARPKDGPEVQTAEQSEELKPSNKKRRMNPIVWTARPLGKDEDSPEGASSTQSAKVKAEVKEEQLPGPPRRPESAPVVPPEVLPPPPPRPQSATQAGSSKPWNPQGPRKDNAAETTALPKPPPWPARAPLGDPAAAAKDQAQSQQSATDIHPAAASQRPSSGQEPRKPANKLQGSQRGKLSDPSVSLGHCESSQQSQANGASRETAVPAMKAKQKQPPPSKPHDVSQKPFQPSSEATTPEISQKDEEEFAELIDPDFELGADFVAI